MANNKNANKNQTNTPPKTVPPGGPVESFKNLSYKHGGIVNPPASFDDDSKDETPTNPEDPTDKKEETESEDSPNKKTLEKAIFLLKEAQKGISVIIGGTGPIEDRVNGLYYQDRHDSFLIEQWEKQVSELLKEVEDGT